MSITGLRYADRLGPNGTLTLIPRSWQALQRFWEGWRLSNKYARQGLDAMTLEELRKFVDSLLWQKRHEKAKHVIETAFNKKDLPDDTRVILWVLLMKTYAGSSKACKKMSEGGKQKFISAKRWYVRAAKEVNNSKLKPTVRAYVLDALAEFDLERNKYRAAR